MLVIRSSNLYDKCSNRVIRGLETRARRGWFRFRMGKIRESFLEELACELKLEGPVELEWEIEDVEEVEVTWNVE